MALEQETELYNQIKPDLLATAPGQWVMIRGGELIGLYPDMESALADAATRGFEPGTFLVKQVVEQEPIEMI